MACFCVTRAQRQKKPRFAKAPRAFVLLQNRRDVEVGKAPETHLNDCIFFLLYWTCLLGFSNVYKSTWCSRPGFIWVRPLSAACSSLNSRVAWDLQSESSRKYGDGVWGPRPRVVCYFILGPIFELMILH